MSKPKPRFALLQVTSYKTSEREALENMAELEQLVETYGGEVSEKSIQHKNDPNPNTYIGGGKIEWLKGVVKEKEIHVVVLNDIVRSGQLFRLERELWDVNTHIKVWDRVGLILAIFDQHAKTTEAKLQIELAGIKHIGPRVYGLGGTVLSKQGGGIGTRGAGETNIEMEHRHIKRRTQQIEKELAARVKVQQARINERRKNGVKTVALVGYTSAGKTTLFNALTGKEKEENKKLFTTLDSVLGKIRIPYVNDDVLLSDTIGFIENLPPLLIDAFRSTLMESIQADVLLHVIDSSDPKMREKIDIVQTILRELPAEQEPILVLNKIDKLTNEQRLELMEQFLGTKHILVSANTKEGFDELKRIIKENLL